jgi:CubicO group peptidase (beta-lactamase class C family)
LGLACVVLSAAFAGRSAAEPADARTRAAEEAERPDLAAELAAYAQTEVRRLGHPGMAVGVVVGDRVVFRQGYGTKDKRRADPVATDTVFRIGSITKVFAGIALLQLRDAGKLTLDDPVAQHLPEAKALPLPPTLRHLVTHTSGLPRDVPSGGTSEAEFLAKLRWIGTQTRPGSHTQYSNLAMGLVGPVVRRVSGEPFRDYMRAHVFAPLGMTDTAWEKKDVDPHKLATGHAKVKEGERKDKIDPQLAEWQMGAAEAFGGMYASLDDLTGFVRFELAAWRAGPGPFDAVLSRASLQESQTVAITGPPEPQRYGVNWWLDDDATYGPGVHHTGATDEYTASVVLLPRREVGVIVLSNFGPAPWDVEAIAKRILRKAASLAVTRAP